MAGFILFWHMTPAEYYALRVPEQNAMFQHMDDVIEARKKANRTPQRGRGRRGRR